MVLVAGIRRRLSGNRLTHPASDAILDWRPNRTWGKGSDVSVTWEAWEPPASPRLVDCDRRLSAGGLGLFRSLPEPQQFRPLSVRFPGREPFGHVAGVGDRAVSDRLLGAALVGTVRPRDGETSR
jgi:hypothetical protein